MHPRLHPLGTKLLQKATASSASGPTCFATSLAKSETVLRMLPATFLRLTPFSLFHIAQPQCYRDCRCRKLQCCENNTPPVSQSANTGIGPLQVSSHLHQQSLLSDQERLAGHSHTQTTLPSTVSIQDRRFGTLQKRPPGAVWKAHQSQSLVQFSSKV